MAGKDQNAAASAAEQVVEGTQAAEQTGTEAPAEKKLSPKNKLSRGIPQDWKSSWVDYNQDPAKNEIINKAAKQRKLTVVDMLRGLLEKAVDADWTQLEADATAYVPTVNPDAKRKPAKKLEDMTTAELEKKVARETAQLERSQAQAAKAAELLAAARARAAGGTTSAS